MGKLAAAGYLQRFRELRGISRAAVARSAGTSDQNIFRIEVDGQEPRAEMLALFVHAIDADIVDVYDLLLIPDASRAEGEHRAEERFRVVQRAAAGFQSHTPLSTRSLSVAAADDLTDLRQRLTHVEADLYRLQTQLQSLMPPAAHPSDPESSAGHPEHDPAGDSPA
jgi:transcriptional regulator with XRE-family HTH domain